MLLLWRVQSFGGLPLGLALATILGALMLWLSLISPPPGQEINIPHRFSCYSKYAGGYCERTGGFDRKGRPWGTEVPKLYRGPPTKDDAARIAARPGQ